MDSSLYFDEQHEQVREMVRAIAQEHVAPVAKDLDRDQEFPWANIKTMGELGILGVPWPEELGGAGLDQISYYVTIHELAKVDACARPDGERAHQPRHVTNRRVRH